jgi:hypothetical protein
VKPF